MNSLLRALRRENDLSLEKLGELTGLSKSYLSKVERGVNTPSIAAALKIAEALDVEVSRLFAEEGQEASIAIDRVGNKSKGSGQEVHPLAAERLGKLASPFLLVPDQEYVEHWSEHPGEEFIFVHEGEIELHYENRKTVLEKGDSAYLDATKPHRIRRFGAARAVVLIVAIKERK